MKWWLLLAAALTSGCGGLGRPPLPKLAAGESGRPAPAEEIRNASVARADVIYFSLTKKAAAESHSIWSIVDTLQQSGAGVALGWTELPANQKVLFEQWKRQEISGQQLMDQLGKP
ncbi:hypothetical protein BH20VER3_BH20VER3_01860 [soil metagenome]